jgi:hypothetical protein
MTRIAAARPASRARGPAVSRQHRRRAAAACTPWFPVIFESSVWPVRPQVCTHWSGAPSAGHGLPLSAGTPSPPPPSPPPRGHSSRPRLRVNSFPVRSQRHPGLAQLASRQVRDGLCGRHGPMPVPPAGPTPARRPAAALPPRWMRRREAAHRPAAGSGRLDWGRGA